jgi:large-conductance mechanosensitive channel
VVAAFFKSLNDGILVPLLAPAASAGKGVSGFSIKVGSAELKVGQVITELVNLIVSFALVVFTIGLLRSYVLSKIGAARRKGGEE